MENRAEQILEICNKVSRIEDINYVLPGTKNAYAFNRFLDYANDKDIEMLVQKTRMYEISFNTRRMCIMQWRPIIKRITESP